MQNELFSPMAIDALGEMMNISLGSSATAVSNMLDHRVDITTPKVSVVPIGEFSIGNLEPAIGVEIKYVEGLEGSNIMLLKRSDIKIIVDILMGMETPDEEFELNELTISAVCEVMNQMMGAASTALSDFLGFSVNISTPESFELDDFEEFKRNHLPQEENLVVVSFALKIEEALESEFMNVMPVHLANEILARLGIEEGGESVEAPAPAPEPEATGKKLSQEEIEAMMQGGGAAASAPAPAPEATGKKLSQEEIEAMMQGVGAAAPAPAPAPEATGKKLSQEEIEAMMQGGGAMAPAPAPAPAAPTPAPAPSPVGQQMSQEEIEKMMQGGMPGMPGMPAAGAMPFANGQMGYPYPYPYPPYPYPYPPQPQKEAPEPKVINATPVAMEELPLEERIGKEQAQNLDLIMEVPLQVAVEIGRTQRKVQEILSFAKGSLVVLDKLAGDQVDVFVNGKCVAKGDVVVIDDNFGVRITEIIQNEGIEGIL